MNVSHTPATGEAIPETSAPAPLSTSSGHRRGPPEWLLEAKLAMEVTYRDDRFDILLKKATGTAPAEWRVKCVDCPGKLYTPGPGESLTNFEVHLKNRQHRRRVCGKYWHRHRRPLPVVYNSDAEHHQNRIRDAETSRTQARKRGWPVGSTTGASTPIVENATLEPDTPLRSGGDVSMDHADPPSSSSPSPSSSSSATETPLAQRASKMNGTSHSHTPVPAGESTPDEKPLVNQNTPATGEAITETSAPAPLSTSSGHRRGPPEWLLEAKVAMEATYPDDRFDILLKKATGTAPAEWRVKCVDCPGKLYTLGPDESLSNFEVHLKNRQHRQRVNEQAGLE